MLVDPFYQQLIAAGHIVVDVQWSNGIWYSAAAGELAGPEALACRPATVMRWVHDNWLPAGLRYAVIGSSAGSSAVSYSLTTYGMNSLVQLLVPISGPPHARLTYNCLNPSPDDALGTNGEHVIDFSWGYVNDTYGPCYFHDPNFTSEWDANSVETGGFNYFWPSTQVHFIVGGQDTQGIRDNATALFHILTANSTAATYEVVPNMGHPIAQSQDGLNALLTVLTASPAPTPSPTPSPTPTPTATPTPTPAVSGLTYNGGSAFVNGTNLISGQSYTVAAQTQGNTQSVVFRRDGAVVKTDSATPFDFRWTPTAIGTHTFAATPWSSSGGTGTSGASITVSFIVVKAPR